MIGTKKFVAQCQALEKKYGARFRSNKASARQAAKGETFTVESRKSEEGQGCVRFGGVTWPRVTPSITGSFKNTIMRPALAAVCSITAAASAK